MKGRVNVMKKGWEARIITEYTGNRTILPRQEDRVWKENIGAIIGSLLKSQLNEIWRKYKSFDHRQYNGGLF